MSLPISPAGRRYGRIADVPDHRDRVLKLAAPPRLPRMADESRFLGPVLNQGQLGSCTGHGWAEAREWLYRKFHLYEKDKSIQPDEVRFSPLFIYYQERLMEGTVHEDAGAQVRTGAKVLNQFGVCPESADPYDVHDFDALPGGGAYHDAQKYRGGAYHRLDSLLEMKSCLASGYVFVCGIDVYGSFEAAETAKSGEVPVPAAGEDLLGGIASSSARSTTITSSPAANRAA